MSSPLGFLSQTGLVMTDAEDAAPSGAKAAICFRGAGDACETRVGAAGAGAAAPGRGDRGRAKTAPGGGGVPGTASGVKMIRATACPFQGLRTPSRSRTW